MAKYEEPTPRYPLPDHDLDAGETPDLPLTSIPSIPSIPPSQRRPIAEPDRGLGRYILAGGILFVLILAVGLLGARYLKMPQNALPVATVSDTPFASESPIPAPPAHESPTPEPLPAVIESTPAPIDRHAERIAKLEKTIAEERDARKRAEESLAEAKSAAASRATEAAAAKNAQTENRELAKKAIQLEKRIKQLDTDLGESRKETAAASKLASAREGQVDQLRQELEASQRAATGASDDARRLQAQQDSALKGESEAVRQLVASLETERGKAKMERERRVELERRVRELEATRERAESPLPDRRADSRPPESDPEVAQVVEPRRVKTVPPRYPEAARSAGKSGRVILRVLVDEAGTVGDVEITSSPDSMLASAAATAARRWEYTPGRKNGVRTEMWITEAVDFTP